MKPLDPSTLTINPQRPGIVAKLSVDLTRSLRRPTSRTLILIEKALAWLQPFESGKAMVSSSYEKRELLELLTTHRMALCPYIDIERIEWNLRLDGK